MVKPARVDYSLGPMRAHERLLNFIDGEWVDSESRAAFPNLDPSDARVTLGEAPRSTARDAARAVEAAERALPAWSRVPAPRRGDLLLEVMHKMTERKAALARALTLEEGKTFAESMGEVQKSINVLKFMAGEALRLNGQTAPSELARTFAYTVRSPIGVVGAITPWNFPVCIPVWKLAPALLAGNTVVLKPSPFTPWTAHLLVELFAEAGLPRGVLNLVHGFHEPGEALLTHPKVKALTFTGSTKTGTHVYATGARLLKRVQCEMGGKNPVIVLEDADLHLAAVATAQGAFGSTGQRCTATSRLIVVESRADELVDRIRAEAEKMRVGPGLEPGVDMGPSVSAEQLEKVLGYHEVARAEGHRLVHGGGRLTEGALAHGYFTAPTTYDHVAPDSRLAQEEVFGPVLAVIRVKGFEEAIQVANGVAYGLSSSVFTRDVARAMEYVDLVETGMLHVNSSTIGGEAHLPFGGVKATSFGYREMGPTAIDFYTETKTVYVDYTGQKRESKIY